MQNDKQTCIVTLCTAKPMRNDNINTSERAYCGIKVELDSFHLVAPNRQRIINGNTDLARPPTRSSL